VEDNPADLAFFREALASAALPVQLHAVNNGGDAMAFLRRQGRFPDAPRPDVVILDLNVPVRSGRELLVDMAGDGTLCQIPIVILTTSTFERDIVTLYTRGRCRYEVKTANFDKLTAIAAGAHAFGLSCRQPV
jgi:CheY-like chemotaxis protein